MQDVRLALERGDVEVGVELVGETLVCTGLRGGLSGVRPTAAGVAASGHDAVPSSLVRAEVPRVRCAEHGVQQVPVPWADAQARFTALYEAMVIDWLKVASFAAVARQCRFSWDQVSGNPGAGGAAGAVAARGGRGDSGGRRRDVLSTAARIRHRRQ